MVDEDDDDDDVPLGLMYSTSNEASSAAFAAASAAASTNRDPVQPILVDIESSTPRDDCVSLDAKDTLSDVSSSPAVGDTAISLNLPIHPPHDESEDVDETLTSPRENHSETIGDVHPPQKDSTEVVIAREGIVNSTLDGMNDIPLSVASPDSFSIDYIVSILP